MKYFFIFLLLPIYLFSQSASTPQQEVQSLKVYKIDLDNKLSLTDTSLVYSKTYSDKDKYSEAQVMLDLIEVSYPSTKLLSYLKVSEHDKMDSTYDDGITTYKFYSWCHKDTTDWDTDDNGKIVYEIEVSDCKLKDIIKTDSKNRMIHYTFSSMGHESSEDYRFDDNDKLAEITSFKGHFMLYYDKLGRLDRIVEDYQNIGNIIETMGSSLKREITYQFEYDK